MINLKAILFSITVKLGAIHKVLTIKLAKFLTPIYLYPF